MDQNNNKYSKINSFFHFAGYQYWTFILFPALVGTTLPFWHDPPGFSFKWFVAIEFLIAAVLFFSGYSFLYAGFGGKKTISWTKSKLLLTGTILLLAAVLLGLHINSNLQLNQNVYRNIFLVYIAAALFIGILYIVPPIRFCDRIGGEMIFGVGLGMMPVIGAYLLQVGDLHRTAYLASLPLVVSTGLWVWVSELISRLDDEKTDRKTIVMLFSQRFAARYLTLLLILLVYASLLLAVIGRSSLNPLSLVALFSVVLAVRVIHISWKEYNNINKMRRALHYVFLIHIVIGTVIILSSLSSLIIKL